MVLSPNHLSEHRFRRYVRAQMLLSSAPAPEICMVDIPEASKEDVVLKMVDKVSASQLKPNRHLIVCLLTCHTCILWQRFNVQVKTYQPHVRKEKKAAGLTWGFSWGVSFATSVTMSIISLRQHMHRSTVDSALDTPSNRAHT
jgi:hypothetical protein